MNSALIPGEGILLLALIAVPQVGEQVTAWRYRRSQRLAWRRLDDLTRRRIEHAWYAAP